MSVQIARNFWLDEFKCRCGKRGKSGTKKVNGKWETYCEGSLDFFVNPGLLVVLQAMRDEAGVPIRITSGRRCRAYNHFVGGVRHSQHIFEPHGGKKEGVNAADVKIANMGVRQTADLAKECGARGIGLYWGPRFVHVDVRPGPESEWERND